MSALLLSSSAPRAPADAVEVLFFLADISALYGGMIRVAYGGGADMDARCVQCMWRQGRRQAGRASGDMEAQSAGAPGPRLRGRAGRERAGGRRKGGEREGE
eukprot:1389018-Rhodomonas_salina.1